MEHEKDFFEYHRNKYNLSDSVVKTLRELFKPETVKAGETFLKEDAVNHDCYIVGYGLVKGVFSREGRERILGVYFDGEPIIVPVTRYSRARISLVAVEDSVICRSSRNELDMRMRHDSELACWRYEVVAEYAHLISEDYLNFFWMNKTETYNMLVSKYPDILQRMSQKDIAAYLNITEQSLSRIRASKK